MKSLIKLHILILSASLLLAGCHVFSELQTAKMLKKGEKETLGSISFYLSPEPPIADVHLGFQRGYGITDRLNWRWRYETGIWELHAFGTGPKYGLDGDKTALYFPIGFGYEKIFETVHWQFQPSIIRSLPARGNNEAYFSFKPIIPLWDKEIQTISYAINIGYGIVTASGRYVVSPELGMLLSKDQSDGMVHFSIGFASRK